MFHIMLAVYRPLLHEGACDWSMLNPYLCRPIALMGMYAGHISTSTHSHVNGLWVHTPPRAVRDVWRAGDGLFVSFAAAEAAGGPGHAGVRARQPRGHALRAGWGRRPATLHSFSPHTQGYPQKGACGSAISASSAAAVEYSLADGAASKAAGYGAAQSWPCFALPRPPFGLTVCHYQPSSLI